MMYVIFPRFRRVLFDDVPANVRREFFSRSMLSMREGWIRVAVPGGLYIVNKRDEWYKATQNG